MHEGFRLVWTQGSAGRVAYLNTVDSTNRYLMQMAKDGAPDGQVVIANHQSAGRGRLSRAFHSPEGMGLYYSYLIRATSQEELSPAAWTKVTSMTAVAVSDAVETVCGVRPKIKWVNDLYLEGKKICGILTQMDTEPETGHVRGLVIGIGINVHQKEADFPEEIRDIAGSLLTQTGKDISRKCLAEALTPAMDRMREAFPDEEDVFLERYREDSFLPGLDVTVISGEEEKRARVLRVEDDYALRVRYDDGTEESLRGGEVSIRTQQTNKLFV